MKILIVDDDGLIRDSLKIILELEDDIEVVGTASNGDEALRFCEEYLPNIVLMDIRMPVMDGVLCTKKIKEKYKDIKVIVLTTFKDDEYIKEAIKNGAEGYILKSQPSESIVESVKAVYQGNSVFNKDITNIISTMLKEDSKHSPQSFDLTKKEYIILKLIGEGLSNKEVSKELYLSEGTVRNYVTLLLEKLNLRDRTQLAIFYLKNF